MNANRREIEEEAMWDLCGRTWAFWFGCVVAFYVLVAVGWTVLAVVAIAAGFCAIGYFGVRVTMFSRRRRR